MKKLFFESPKVIITISLLIIFLIPHPGKSQFNFKHDQNNFPLRKIQKALKEKPKFNHIPKRPGHYTAEDWRAVIDSTWGPGLPTETKLRIFDEFWNYIDDNYPSFININVNWDSLYNVYRPEVAAGVSR